MWTSDIKRKPGRPRKNWIDTVQRDLKDIGMTWELRSATACCQQRSLASQCGPMCLRHSLKSVIVTVLQRLRIKKNRATVTVIPPNLIQYIKFPENSDEIQSNQIESNPIHGCIRSMSNSGSTRLSMRLSGISCLEVRRRRLRKTFWLLSAFLFWRLLHSACDCFCIIMFSFRCAGNWFNKGKLCEDDE